MKPSKIKYDPYKTIRQIADESGVSVDAVRKYIRTRKIDRQGDIKRIMALAIREYRKSHHDATIKEVAAKLIIKYPGTDDPVKDNHGNEWKISVATVRKYWNWTEDESNDEENDKKSALYPDNYVLKSVICNSQYKILRAILDTHLGRAASFDCDPTYGTGRFYNKEDKERKVAGDMMPPKYRYDIRYDLNPDLRPAQDVKPLSEIHKYPLLGAFRSMVIDMPYRIKKPVKVTSPSIDSFPSEEKLKMEYRKIFETAYRTLASEGILVVKTVDYPLPGDRFFLSDWVLNEVIAQGFELRDKYIYQDLKAEFAASSSSRRTKNPQHAYFFVFRKIDPKFDAATQPKGKDAVRP